MLTDGLSSSAVCVSAAVVLVLVIAQIVLVERVIRQMQPDRAVGTETMVDKLSYKHYALATSMLNSFLVGGVTFGFSGMSLMLRQEGAYASQCACGSFCASEKEQLAVVSTVGFVVAIGSRLFVGLLLDSKGALFIALLEMRSYILFVLNARSQGHGGVLQCRVFCRIPSPRRDSYCAVELYLCLCMGSTLFRRIRNAYRWIPYD